MYNGQIIRTLLEARKIQNKELLTYLGYNRDGGNSSLNQIIEGNPTVRRLEPVADFFQVSMDVFFERNIQFATSPYVFGNGNAVGNGNTIMTHAENEYKMRIENLERLLEEKDKRIETLQTLVDILQKKQ